MDFPYSVAQILDTATFLAFGGETGTATHGQLQAAYLAAEMQATDAIGTFLVPTVVTGTYPYPFSGKALILPYHHIIGIYSVTPQSPKCYANCDLLAGDGCAFQLDDGGWGYVYIRNTSWIASQCCQGSNPISVQLVYQAGLATGTAMLPTNLLGLTKVAQIFLNEIIDPGANEGGEGDPGVASWSSAGHMEVRKPLGNTVLGNSPAANLANRMFRRMRPCRALKLGW